MSQVSESITLEQLADHNSLESLWIAVHGHVYNLTNFSADHPGGIEALETSAGTDGTESYDYANHSESNMSKMQQYRIGTLAGSVEPAFLFSHTVPLTDNEKIRSAISDLKPWRMPRWTKLTISVIAISLATSLSYGLKRPFVQGISPALSIPQLHSSQHIGNAFFGGVAIAWSISLVGFKYLYNLFMSTLDYQNDAFSFPPTITRKIKR